MQYNVLSIPSAPTGVVVTRAGTRELSISWNSPGSTNPPITNYSIQLSKDNGSNWFSINKPISTQTTHIARGLDLSSGTWLAKIQAINSEGRSSYSSSSSPANLSWIPDSPTNIVATGILGGIKLNWTAPVNNSSPVTGYKIYRTTIRSTNPYVVTINNTGNTLTEYIFNSGLDIGQTYFFKVSALNNVGESILSNASNGVTVIPVPPSPSNITVKPQNQAVFISWDAPRGFSRSITDYIIQYSTDNGITWITFNNGLSINTTVTVTGLTNGTTYKFRVACVTTGGTGQYAESGSVIPYNVPAAPASPICIPGSGDITVFWSPQNGELLPITDFIIEVSKAAINSSKRSWAKLTKSDYPFLKEIWKGPTPNSVIAFLPGPGIFSKKQFYVFRVYLKNDIGWSAPSQESALVTINDSCSEPRVVTAKANINGTITVRWQIPEKNTGGPITDYFIQYETTYDSTNPTNPYHKWGIWNTVYDSVTNNTSVTVSGLTVGSAYRFRVRAYNVISYGLFGDIGRGAVFASTGPSAPRNLRGVVDRNYVGLVWDPPLSMGGAPFSRYRIQASTNNGATWNVLRKCGNSTCYAPNGAQDDPATPYHTVGKLTGGRDYWFRVAAVSTTNRGTFTPKVGPFTIPVVYNYNKSSSLGGSVTYHVNWALLRCVTDFVQLNQ